MAVTADGSLGSAELDKRYGTVSVTLPAGPVRQLTVAASVLPAADRTYELFFSPVWKLEDGSMQQVGALCSVPGWGGDAAWGLQFGFDRYLSCEAYPVSLAGPLGAYPM